MPDCPYCQQCLDCLEEVDHLVSEGDLIICVHCMLPCWAEDKGAHSLRGPIAEKEQELLEDIARIQQEERGQRSPRN